MKYNSTSKSRGKFDVLAATRQAQAAMMTLAPKGVSDDEIGNEHPRSEQWLFVLAGSGTAIIRSAGTETAVALKRGSLLTIEKGELHQIRNTGRTRLRTINFYVPPAYSTAGEVKQSVTK
ncbi:MAG TPA: cupin domain-containing protein [Lacipirellulaceae bacterium]|jgi:mannose-6-phosphate isomerase-like protein (cupin superfamily)|nr:cupin domain-containing protein [Lacipirellulaceae bacterium]